MKPERDESAYRHRARVRIGIDGPKGTLLKCLKKDNSGAFYWRIKLDGVGGWEWPDARMILDGPGDRVTTCECGLKFFSDGKSPLCSYCDALAFGTQARATEAGDLLRDPELKWRFKR